MAQPVSTAELPRGAAPDGMQPGTRPVPITQAGTRNALLRSLSPADFALLQPHLERVPLVVNATLAQVGQPIETVCFLEGAIAGFLDVLDDGRQLAVGLVGREGFVGWPLLMGGDRWQHEVTVRAENSTAIRIGAEPMLRAVADSATLRGLMLRFAGNFMLQMSRTIVSNLIHPVERRTARWLLLYHDRIAGDEIVLTHEELSIMLGVRRASVTDALHMLEGDHAIRGLRGRVVIADRARLEAMAGETYGYAEAEYRRLVAPMDRAER
ncbi:Crp/Fnr family transcriptional regulator [Sphingomonas montana]|uniref:Crp/Fnr family transcriptional regulator n=1 Tax=Sphingomonas montana TaxID=1843236 RepID=UPI0013EDAE57|nr:Crp/Fnr family transcriptional regulator [Sphingomonas montana]